MRHNQIPQPSDHNAIGNAIAIRRRELGLTQEQLAFRVDLSRQSISNIEQGKQVPSGRALIRILTLLDTPADEAHNHKTTNDPRLESIASQLKEMPEQDRTRFFDIADIIIAGLIHSKE